MNGAWNLLKGFFNWFGEKIQWAKNLWSGIKGFFDGNDGDGDGNGDGTRSQILRSAIMALLALALERLLEHLHRAEMLSQARP